MTFIKRTVFAKILPPGLWYAFAFAICPTHKANAEFYIGAAGQFNWQRPSIKWFNSSSQWPDLPSQEKKITRIGADVVMGCIYSSGITLASQVIVGYGGKNIKHAVDVTNQSGTTAGTTAGTTDSSHVISDVSLRNPLRCGAEVLVGASLGVAVRTFPYAILGYMVEYTQVRGSMFVEKDAKKSVIYFGKDAVTVQGIEMPAVRPLRKFVSTPVFGGGVRLSLMGKAFVGLEFRYFPRTSRNLMTQCTRIDPLGVFGTASTSLSTEKIKIPANLTHYSVGVVVGFCL
ncbi:MAG: hypothetical protein LBF66_03310 [Holosporales bacterium]|jgi:hypothetical protein|nr:hypothetical protein [Holosporales bacterium]